MVLKIFEDLSSVPPGPVTTPPIRRWVIFYLTSVSLTCHHFTPSSYQLFLIMKHSAYCVEVLDVWKVSNLFARESVT